MAKRKEAASGCCIIHQASSTTIILFFCSPRIMFQTNCSRMNIAIGRNSGSKSLMEKTIRLLFKATLVAWFKKPEKEPFNFFSKAPRQFPRALIFRKTGEETPHRGRVFPPPVAVDGDVARAV